MLCDQTTLQLVPVTLVTSSAKNNAISHCFSSGPSFKKRSIHIKVNAFCHSFGQKVWKKASTYV